MVDIKQHNRNAVDQCAAALKSNLSTCYVSGVGTGKTYVFLAVVESILSHNDRILYVVPKYSVADNTVKTIETYMDSDRFDFVCYNKFKTIESTKSIDDYSLVVFDECHHLGSDVYGQNLIEWLKNNKTVKVLGLTATPLREDDLDVSQLFDETVRGISVFEAIKMELMAPIDYRICFIDKPEYIKDKTKKTVFELDYNLSTSLMVQMVRSNPRNKWICYFPSIKKLRQYRDYVAYIFGREYKILELYSSLSNLKQVMKKARECKKCVILSCDILLEGVHIPDITGIVLFRNVTSVPTLQQIIGRTCSIGNKTEPFIIDTTKCATKLLPKVFKYDLTFGRGERHTEYSRLKSIIKVGINKQANMDITELLHIIQGKEFKFMFRGVIYHSVLEACKEYNIPIHEFHAVRREYKLSVEQTLQYLVALKGD